MIKILRIEIDGHFHGSTDVPRPWVAQITGVDPVYGLARTFVERLNDYRAAHRANSGNTYGVVAAFPLHEGNLYEVSRCRGSSSKRYVTREFVRVVDGKLVDLEPADALASVDPYDGDVASVAVSEGVRVSRIDGLGTPSVCGFVIIDNQRVYRLRQDHLHEIDDSIVRRLGIVTTRGFQTLSPRDAFAHLGHSLNFGACTCRQ